MFLVYKVQTSLERSLFGRKGIHRKKESLDIKFSSYCYARGIRFNHKMAVVYFRYY